MKPRNTVLALFNAFLLALPLEAAAGSYSVSGRIVDNNNAPLEYPSTIFRFEIANPSDTCVLYREQLPIDMTNSDGRFSVPLGNGTVQYPTSGYSVSTAISNSKTLTCEGGATYTPSASDTRILRIKFYDGTAWESFTPNQTLRAVPYASEATNSQTVGDVPVTGLLRTNDGSAMPALTATNVTSLMSLISGSSSAYIKSESDPTVMNFAKTSLPACAAGQTLSSDGNTFSCVTSAAGSANGAAGGDLGGNYPNPMVTKIQGVPVVYSGLVSGQILKYNGTQWVSANIATSDVTGLASSLSSYLTQSAFNSSVASASCATNQTMYWNSVSGNFQCQIINVDSIRGRAISGITPTAGQVLSFDGSQWTPTSPSSYLGSLTGDVTATAPSSVSTINTVGGVTAVNVAAGANAANAATNTNNVNTIVKRDAAGSFSAGVITATLNGNASSATTATSANSFTGVLGGDVSGNQNTTYLNKIQGVPLSITSPTDGDMLVYSAGANQWTLKKPQTCDTANGWIKVTRGFPYCIKKVDATAVNFTQQMSKCANAGALLCSFDQVFNACINNAMTAADGTWSSNFNGSSSVVVRCDAPGTSAAYTAISFDQTSAIISSTATNFISYCCKPAQ